MTSSRVRAVLGAAAAAGLLLALTSCAPALGRHHAGGHPGGNPSAGATATPTPTPTVSTLDTTAPTALADVDCNKFVTQAQLTAAFGSTAVTEVQTPQIATGDLQNQDAYIPAMDYVRATGGITCLWTNAPVNYYYTAPGAGGFPPYKTIEVSVLFNAHTVWPKVIQLESVTPGNYGDGSCDPGICELDEYIGNSDWMNVTEINQKSSHDPFPTIIDQVKAAVLAAGAVGPNLTPPAGTLALGTTCNAFVSDADASTALGGAPVVSSQPLSKLDDLYYYGMWSGAQDLLGAHPCSWKRAGATVGHLSWLAGGAWAWAEAKSLPYVGAPAQPLAVPGLPNGDSAFIRCAASDSSCVADLILGGNWIEAEVAQPGTTNRAAVTALAAAIVMKVG